MGMLWRYDRERAVGLLTQAEAGSVLRTYGASASVPDGPSASQAAMLLESLWRARQWIACGCEERPALMYPRRRSDGRMELVQHGGHPHTPGCALARIRSLPRVQAAAARDVLTLPKDGAASGIRLLHRLLARARLNEMWPEEIEKHGTHVWMRGDARVRRLDEALAGLDAVGGLTAVAACARSPNALKWIQRMARDGGSGAEREAFLLYVHRDCWPALAFTGPVVSVGGPWKTALTLGCYGSEDGGATWQERSLAMQAINSKADMWPIEGADDARFAKLLMHQILYWHDRGVRVGLEKPLPRVSDRWGADVPPDFVLHLPDGGSVAIVRRQESRSENRNQLKREKRLRAVAGVRAVVVLTKDIDPLRVLRVTTAVVMKAAHQGREERG